VDVDEGGLEVVTEATDDGYEVVISVDADRSWAMEPDQCWRYGRTVMEAAARAAYEAAVFDQFAASDVSEMDALTFIAGMRLGFDKIDDEATTPLRFVPSMTRAGRPFVLVELDGEPVGQLESHDTFEHGVAVIQAAIARNLDTMYRRVLRDTTGLSDAKARQAVARLRFDRGT
jgi:hypothetical protein